MKRLFLSCTLLALSGCSMVGSGPGVPDKGTYISHITPRSDYQTSLPEQQLLSPNNGSEYGILADEELTAYPLQIVDKLLSGWNGTKPPVRIFLVADPNFTSDVSAGGAIFLTAGLLQAYHDQKNLQTEDALAYTLAHELSHILLGHTNAAQRNKTIEGYFTGATELGSIASRTFGGVGLAGGTAKAILSSVGAHEFVNLTLFNMWSREQESQADILALDLMAKAGYSTDEANTVLGVLVTQDENAEKKKAARPDLVKIDENKISLNPGPVASSYLREGFELAEMQHPFAKARLDKVSSYEQREYTDQVTEVQHANIQKWLQTPRMKRFLSGSKNIQTAELAIAGKDWQSARKALSLVSSPLRESVVWEYAMARVLEAQGQSKQAVAIVSSLSQRSDITIPAALAWGHILTTEKRYDEAEAYLANEQNLFNNRTFLPDRIKNAKLAKKDMLEVKLQMLCMASGDEGLQANCDAAGK